MTAPATTETLSRMVKPSNGARNSSLHWEELWFCAPNRCWYGMWQYGAFNTPSKGL